jgi:NAD-dependent SIR2 family protein deacetylase
MNVGFEPLLGKAQNAKNIIVFSGSGLSASSGMSMFSTANGLYQRACKRFGISDGKKLFTWRFYDKQRTEVTSFFVDIHKEAVKAQAGAAHQAVAELESAEKLLRHYTMNVDGLASHVRTLLPSQSVHVPVQTG